MQVFMNTAADRNRASGRFTGKGMVPVTTEVYPGAGSRPAHEEGGYFYNNQRWKWK
jgi:hypothetical protein